MRHIIIEGCVVSHEGDSGLVTIFFGAVIKKQTHNDRPSSPAYVELVSPSILNKNYILRFQQINVNL